MTRLIHITLTIIFTTLTCCPAPRADELWIPDDTTGHLGIYDPHSGNFLFDLLTEHQYNLPYQALCGPGGLIYLNIYGGGSIHVFDWWGNDLYTYLDRFEGPENPTGMDFRGDHLFVACWDGYVAEYAGPHLFVGNFIELAHPRDILFLPDGRSLVSDYRVDGGIYLYDRDGGLIRRVLEEDRPNQLQPDPLHPGTYFTLAYGSGRITRFDLEGNILDRWPFPNGCGIYRLGNGNVLATNNVGVWELDGTTGTVVSRKRDVDAMMIEHAESLPLVLTGAGPGPANLSDVHGYCGTDQPRLEIDAYGAVRYGVNVAVGNVDRDPSPEIITGPGPGPDLWPLVRGFDSDGGSLPGLGFIAYGTPKYGANVAAGDVDGDGYDEILTGAGPGAVFGPHVRAFDYDSGILVNPSPDVNFLAYGTNRFGVNVAAGDIDGDGYDEIVTGAGPGTVFGPHVRGWNCDGGQASPIGGISFFAYGTNQFGVNVAVGDIDGDGMDEIVTGAGPGAVFGPHVRGWNYDGGELTPIAAVNFMAFDYSRFGVKVGTCDVDRDGTDEILAGAGPAPQYGPMVRVYDYDDFPLVLLLDSFAAYPGEGVTHGVNVAGGVF